MHTRITFLLLWIIGASAWSFAQTTQSVLADGQIYKLATTKPGLYRLDYSFLEQLGLNPTTIDPRQLGIYGHHGGFLPEPNADERIDDLQELAIWVEGQEDGSFDAQDYILFYGEGADQLEFLPFENRYHQVKNPYDTKNYYFLKVKDEPGLRIEAVASLVATDYSTDTYMDHQILEDEKHNLLHLANDANLQGSGRKWVGDQFKVERSKNYSARFDFRDVDLSQPVHVHMEFAGRSDRTSTVTLQLGNQQLSASITRANVTDIEQSYAKTGIIKEAVSIDTDAPLIEVSYPRLGNNNEGWLDFIEVNFWRQLVFRGEQFIFTDIRAFDFASTTYNIAHQGSTALVWNISNPFQPENIQVESGSNTLKFGVAQQDEPRYVIFDPANAFTAEALGSIENQNLHGLQEVEYLIVYHPNFEAPVKRLAEHRTNFSKYRVATAAIDQVFNEFSSGKTDPTAIRDLSRMLYQRSDRYRYLLLVGDGSFDYRHIYTDFNNESFIPVYETEESYHPILAYPSDDYYALLDNHEGGTIRGSLDIGVGRFPVRTLDECNIIVDKIIRYDNSEETLGDWRINLLFVADDEDGNRHLNSADGIAEDMRASRPVFNINKIYLDAFEQENTPGGVFNFKAKEALNQSIFKGQLVVNYLGHGGSNGWAQERVLQHEDIDKWNNLERLPLFITATCSFAGYDNPRKITAGEYTLTNATGGSIALFTTVRAVYATSNERLTRSVFEHIFDEVDGRQATIGEILINAKNANSADTTSANARKFTLLGDPGMQLALPKYGVRATRINGKDVSSGNLDTLKALSKVEIEGEIIDQNGQRVSNFNGDIYPTIFDKAVNLRTLAQDDDSAERDFALQKSVIFKGLASVTNGSFKFSFVVPKDINYSFGTGKLSFYAEDGSTTDAGGSFADIYVGGTDPNGIEDENGPNIEIFMDDEDFVFGGFTASDPLLLVKLSDENGINVIGNSIGHDLTAVIDNDFQNTIILNEFYESEKDEYTRGTVRYPLDNLELGQHTLVVKAWDIANNSSETLTEFVVVDEAESGLRHVLNYPNPFSNNTCFQFEHQFQNQDIDIRVDILTPSGRRVATLEQPVKASGILSRDLKWNGTDDFGDRLANGIYIYRVTVRAMDGAGRVIKQTSDLEKLVILR